MILSDELINDIWNQCSNRDDFARAIWDAAISRASQQAPNYQDVPADCLSPTVSRTRRYGEAQRPQSQAVNHDCDI